MLSFESPILILFLGFTFVVLFGLLSLLRREGLSVQFAVEALVTTLLFAGLSASVPGGVNPVLFLLLLYLVTMRVRLSVDVANFLARTGKLAQAERIYKLGARLFPDRTNHIIVRINFGTLRLQQGYLEEAISIFKEILAKASQGDLGVKHEAAAHYNLGVAYLRQDLHAKAQDEFHSVLETWPISEYGKRAEAALKKLPRN
jgi:tetratricopeptide (TPR) repeat protein